MHSNTTYEDILLRDKLKGYADKCPHRFKLWHALSQGPKGKPNWPYKEGRLTLELMRQRFYLLVDGVAAFLCGPSALIEKAAVPGLETMGFERGKNIIEF